MSTGGSTDFSKAWVRFVSEWFCARIFSNNLLSAYFHLEPPLFPLLCSRKQDEISLQEIIALWRLKKRRKAGDKKHGRKERFSWTAEERNYHLERFLRDARSRQPHLCRCFRLWGFAQGHVILQIVAAKKNPAVFHMRLRPKTIQNYSWFLLKVFSSGENKKQQKIK